MADPSPTLPATIRWPSETTRPAEHFTQVYRGEALRISCILTEYAKPIDLTGATVSFFWQPIGADDPTAWWEAPNGAASASGNAVSIVFNAATMDDGHGAYRAFFRIVTQGGATYRANGVLGMLESPGATPNEIPFPPRVLDFAQVTVLNAPYWTKAEADARFASTADATLNGRGYGPWAVTPDTVEIVREYDAAHGDPKWVLYPSQGGDQIGVAIDDTGQTTVTWTAGETASIDITATRTALPGYVLGSQTEKPIPKLSDVPAVVAPSTAASAAGKAADAKATGDALAGKAALVNGEVPLNQLPTYPTTKIYDLTAETPLSDLLPSGVGINNKLVAAADMPSSETWTFEVDDGQGGTTTVTKSVAVFAQAAQGGA